MKLYELLNNIEIQSEICVVYYDFDLERRMEISTHAARNEEVRYLYSENNILYIELEKEEEIEA